MSVSCLRCPVLIPTCLEESTEPVRTFNTPPHEATVHVRSRTSKLALTSLMEGRPSRNSGTVAGGSTAGELSWGDALSSQALTG
jgi:hypothetical protein